MQVSSINFKSINNYYKKIPSKVQKKTFQPSKNISFTSYAPVNCGNYTTKITIPIDVCKSAEEISNKAQGMQNRNELKNQTQKLYNEKVKEFEQCYFSLSKNTPIEGYELTGKKVSSLKDSSIIKEYRLSNNFTGEKRLYRYIFDRDTKNIKSIDFEQCYKDDSKDTISIDYDASTMTIKNNEHKVKNYDVTDSEIVIQNGNPSLYKKNINKLQTKVGDSMIITEGVAKEYEYDENGNLSKFYNKRCLIQGYKSDKLSKTKMIADYIMTFNDKMLEFCFIDPEQTQINENKKGTKENPMDFSCDLAFHFEDETSGKLYRDLVKTKKGIDYSTVEEFRF